jgi:dTDP-L-rhamnose 4-epimerase
LLDLSQIVLDVNTSGTARLLDILVNAKHHVKKLVMASSMSLYGEGKYNCPQCGEVHPPLRSIEQMGSRSWQMKCPKCKDIVLPVPTDELTPLQPTSIYAISKRSQEEMCMIIGRAYDIPITALRYFNVYGPRQALSNPYTGVCAIFSSRIKNNNPPLVFEDGLQTRDFVSVHDIVHCIESFLARMLYMRTQSIAAFVLFAVNQTMQAINVTVSKMQ